MARWVFNGLCALAATVAVGGAGYWLWSLAAPPRADDGARRPGGLVFWTSLMLAAFIWLVALLFAAVAVLRGWWPFD